MWECVCVCVWECVCVYVCGSVCVCMCVGVCGLHFTSIIQALFIHVQQMWDSVHEK